MASRTPFQPFSLGPNRKRTGRDSDDIVDVESLPSIAPKKKTKLDETSDEMTMQRLSTKMDALCLADAHQEVFDTYELLEQILLQLPIKDLFVLQRVSAKWRKVIAESHPLQRRMYLRAQGGVMKPILNEDEETIYRGRVKINPAMEFFAGHRYRGYPDIPPAVSHSRSFGQVGISHYEDDDYTPPILSTSVWFQILQHAPHRNSLPVALGSYREEASWKRMLVSSPPVPAIRVSAYLKGGDVCAVYSAPGERWRDLVRNVMVYNAEGVRFGDLVNLRRTMKQNSRKAGFDEARLNFTTALSLEGAEMMGIDDACDGKEEGDCGCLEMLESS
ncbi:hypothetical protein CLAFUW4_07220 [Fulvia fulva]|uniref:F-box domain-containing protein n=1 Tax=Passalora fulva TaxID=5499 RepID=A0A9Q8PAE2_PASFU|nr:uncharacterized protein CLAFUR5_07353 [Fulvia fulva]KAK4621549.1 hypothetical protein CLAFUR4_07228 [Fulvia fulva]KAK4623388.1 hypothetical protein CLAFUR0_07225 [Fulvia fulva]UJO18829.1 hypothetical protein CLAFUR5_07353 [Fulvia fulva]WPV16136.1 hypothetical protein CLAFUW4_07220 [Fulvia fulva]WPV30817.1 hypothetical protein CLAFUW7_07221 [Fulvia fulva]